MTTAEHIRAIASSNTVTIAGVPWPRYKVLALLVSLLVALVVGIVTMSPAAAVLAGAGAGTLVWLALASTQHLH